MKNKETDNEGFSDKVLRGLKKAFRNLVETKAARDEELVLADEKGRIRNVPAKELLPLLSNEHSNKTMKQKQEEIQELLCKAITQRRLIKFYYESDKSKKKEWRTVEPYIVGIKENGNAFLAALPISELQKSSDKRVTGHYLLKKMDINKLEFLPETYKEPNVQRDRITNTPTIKVICRFVYHDEK